ncbi:MAG: sulfur oxidation c-type cytochrome SoxA [Alphaproteobacteria bacterium]|nr:sulfur oxidation c-type cytochrome SoxA [Alphaproteobacteria bacterium]
MLLVCLSPLARAEIPMEQRLSFSVHMSPENRALQNDLSQHPASLWLQEGQELWQRPAPGNAPSCANCHGEVERMKGVATRYPMRVQDRLLSLDDRINTCRTQRQQAPAWRKESSALLALSAWVSLPSRGLPITPSLGPRDPDWQAGQVWFVQRLGQIGLSCAQCHEERWGRKLGAALIPQGHPTGYPLYRLEWQGMGSLQRRLRNCMNAVRAEPFAPDATEWKQLEAYLMWRARGMALETPALRP